MYLIQDGWLDEVHLEYMVAGHSYLPCDRGFGVLENKFKKVEIINAPSDYVRIIGEVNNTTLTRMTVKEDEGVIYDFKNLLTGVKFRKARKPVMFSKARTIKLFKNEPWKFYIESVLGNAWVNLDPNPGYISKKLPESCPLKPKYPHGQALKLSDLKVDHLGRHRPFLNAVGRAWIDDVLRRQAQARAPNPLDEYEMDDDIDNLQDEDMIDEYSQVPTITHNDAEDEYDDEDNAVD